MLLSFFCMRTQWRYGKMCWGEPSNGASQLGVCVCCQLRTNLYPKLNSVFHFCLALITHFMICALLIELMRIHRNRCTHHSLLANTYTRRKIDVSMVKHFLWPKVVHFISVMPTGKFVFNVQRVESTELCFILDK